MIYPNYQERLAAAVSSLKSLYYERLGATLGQALDYLTTRYDVERSDLCSEWNETDQAAESGIRL